MRAILFVGHGSKDAEGNDQVRQFVNQMITTINEDGSRLQSATVRGGGVEQNAVVEPLLIETCFLEFEPPTIAQGIHTCVAKGATRIDVIPIILLPAGHSKIHIPAAIDEAKLKYPHVTMTYGRPIGIHEEAINILVDRLEEVGINRQETYEDTAVLVVGRGSSDPDANSDLMKLSRLLYETINVKMVDTAFMGVTTPLIDEGIDRCLALGAKKVVVLPFFLFTGVLMKRMERLVATYQDEYPDNSFTLAHYFGYHQRLENIMFDRAQEALEGQVVMNCDTCQYRLDAMDHIDHHHHHHDHDDHHHGFQEHHDHQQTNHGHYADNQHRHVGQERTENDHSQQPFNNLVKGEQT